MIVLDTNVVSELGNVAGDRRVHSWSSAVPETLAITSVTCGELLYGATTLPDGQRKELLLQQTYLIIESFELVQLVLAYDSLAAIEYARIVANRKTSGRPISTADAQIAAICMSQGAAIATRNVKDFQDTGVRIINPWEF